MRVPSRLSALASRRWPIWVFFGIVHVGLGVWNLLPGNGPAGDVLLYQFWYDEIWRSHVIVGINAGWVYPLAALAPIIVAGVGGDSVYLLFWCLLVTALNALGIGMLLRHPTPRRRAAAWWWLAAMLLLGPVAMSRLDAVSAALGVMGVLLLAARPWLAGVILAVATWMKVWPVALILAAITVSKNRFRYIGAGVIVSAFMAAVALSLGGIGQLFTFVQAQNGRGVQLESPFALPWLWAASLGAHGISVYYDTGILTWEVLGNGISVAASLSTPLLVAAMVLIFAFGARAAIWRVDATHVLAPLGVALVSALLVLNKVGSPQYQSWYIPVIVLGLVVGSPFSKWAARLTLLSALLTQLVYPDFYGYLLGAEWPLVLIVTLRTLCELALLVGALVALWRSPRTFHSFERAERADAFARARASDRVSVE